MQVEMHFNMWDASFFVGYVTPNVGETVLHPFGA